MTVFVYWPVADNGFIDLDSWDYYSDRYYQGLNSTTLFGLFKHKACQIGMCLSYMLDAELFGQALDLVNLVIHMANANLLFSFYISNGQGRLFLSILFAIHPT